MVGTAIELWTTRLATTPCHAGGKVETAAARLTVHHEQELHVFEGPVCDCGGQH